MNVKSRQTTEERFILHHLHGINEYGISYNNTQK